MIKPLPSKILCFHSHGTISQPLGMVSCGEMGLWPHILHTDAHMEFGGRRPLAAVEMRGGSAAPSSGLFEHMPWSEHTRQISTTDQMCVLQINEMSFEMLLSK